MAAALCQTSLIAGKAVRAQKAFAGRQVAAPTNGVRVQAKAGNWLPGSDTPSYLENVPGSFGFDPLGLASNPASLQRFQEAELVHCRWAMLGAAGVLGVEALGFGDWYSAPLWAVNGGTPTYFGVPVPFDLTTLLVIEFIAIAGAEAQRAGEPDAEKRKYPGGAFDPAGFSNGASFEEYKLKEIKNGRLAMLATVGFLAVHAASGLTPLAALQKHIADPWGANFATNGVSLPFA